MRGALLATGVMNLLVSVLFLPSAEGLRSMAGLPPAGNPVYVSTVCLFVLLFGLGYLWDAVTGRPDRLFIGVAAVGKLSFVGLVVWWWAAGALPLRAPLAASGDVVFGLLFLSWLLGSRAGA